MVHSVLSSEALQFLQPLPCSFLCLTKPEWAWWASDGRANLKCLSRSFMDELVSCLKSLALPHGRLWLEAFLVVTRRAGNATNISWVQDRDAAKPLQCTGQPPQSMVCFQKSTMPTTSKSKHCLTHLLDDYSTPLALNWERSRFASKGTFGCVWKYVWLSQPEVGDGIGRVVIKDVANPPSSHRTAPNNRESSVPSCH